ncbi:MAG: sodium:solute symporter family protein [Cryomorphaceae bacterium]|nr:MAG: sodium:solute symporter family protein [Cryomorphaceae bacterium]
MHWIDISIFVFYMIGMLAVGYYFLRRNKTESDYYVSGRNMGPWHIGLSVVATDVGGGFSIGLGGLGFVMGLSGSWMLFTGLLGAWLSAVWLIPKVIHVGREKEFLTFPQMMGHFFNQRVALLAAVISAIGYLGFTSSQLLAGAKLASATVPEISLHTALLVMGFIAVVYTAFGGLKAVIYTDTFQWALLLAGLIFIGIPMAYIAVGGMEAITAVIGSEMLAFSNISPWQLLNWAVTIIPIWFIGMTLYQRIYASRDEKSARKAWYIAGFFEWPVMALMGVALGLLARVAAEQGLFSPLGFATAAGVDPETGLPMLLSTILPVGLMGLMLAAYFSAILSTADSCLMAASGNLQTDILGRWLRKGVTAKSGLYISQAITLVLGAGAVWLAWRMTNVLELMLYSYAFMVSGMFVPVIAALFWRNARPTAAFWSMLAGGSVTLYLITAENNLPGGYQLPQYLDANLFGITASLAVFVGLQWIPQFKSLIISSQNS